MLRHILFGVPCVLLLLAALPVIILGATMMLGVECLWAASRIGKGGVIFRDHIR